MITIRSTKEVGRSHGIKMMVYGQAGSGKTRLCATTGEPTLIVSAEAGLLSLAGYDIDVAEIRTVDHLGDVYRFVTGSDEAKKYRWICIDSLSELAEVMLTEEKRKEKDGRRAYMVTQDQMTAVVRTFRDLPGKNVYMSAKVERIKDDFTGAMLYSPSMPGQKLGASLAYFFDEVFALRVEKDDQGELQRWLQTGSDVQYIGKDRSGKLDMFEPVSLKTVAEKIQRQ